MSETPKLAEVKTLYRSNATEVPQTLEFMARGIKDGSYGKVTQAAVVLLTSDGVEVFGLGKVDAKDTHYLLAAAQHILVEALLESDEGSDAN